MRLQILFGSGDALAQQAVDRRGLEKHDFARTGRMALYGGGGYTRVDISLQVITELTNSSS